MSTLENSNFEEHGSHRWLRPVFWFIAIALGALQAWERWVITEDGLSYLEIGEAYFRGDWKNAINAYWSPLYSWILGFVLHTVRPSRFWESTVVHSVNFAIYLGALGAFDFFLCQLIKYHREKSSELTQNKLVTLSEGAWIALAYGLFIWSSLEWITVPLETPDMLLTVFVYLAAGILLRIRMGAASWLTFAFFGAVLGFGYLTKSAMFPLAFVFLAMSWFLIRDFQNAMPRVLLALAIFLTVASPYILAISLAKGRPTFGDAGKFAYNLLTNGETTRQYWEPTRQYSRLPHDASPGDPNWHLEFPDERRPKHPTQKVLDRPALYAFGSQIGGTYPPWYDPSYWHDGEVSHFNLRAQLRMLKWNARALLWIIFAGAPFLVFGSFIFFHVAGRGRRSVWEIAEHWVLLIPSLAALGMYALVLLEPRYVAVFVVLLWIGIFSGVRLPDSKECRRLIQGVPIAILIMMAIHFGPEAYAAARGEVPMPSHWQWKIAEGLQQLGIQPGDKVAIIGYGCSAYWARLAQVRIVAELFSEGENFLSVKNVEEMLSKDGSLKPEAVQAFARTGANVIVARKVPRDVSKNGWRELGSTGWYAYILPR